MMTYTITTVVREKHSSNVIETWSYDFYIGAQLDWSKLSPKSNDCDAKCRKIEIFVKNMCGLTYGAHFVGG